MEKTTGSRPVPDPTELTTAIVNEAKGDLRREIGQLEKTIDVKFAGVQTQIVERDTSIKTALEAAEKAVGKSENGFTKQIDEMARTYNAVTGGMNKEIDDMKRRLGAIEGRTAGVGVSASVVGGMVLGLIALASVIIAAIAIFTRAPTVAPAVVLTPTPAHQATP
jgi:hypothetical protein